MIYYDSSKLKLGQLKGQCRERGLKVGGRKSELVSRLENASDEQRSGTTVTPTVPHVASQTQADASDSEAAEINPAQVLAETAALENYFQHGFGQEMNNDKGPGGESDDGEDEQELEEAILSDNEESRIVDNPKTRPALAWADKFILEMRRKGGRQTENSVLKLWKVSENHY